MSYGRIRRGPMAADAFTQIRNAVFRDVRLSAKAMGIFGNISTHRDGWGITPESISTQMRDGVDSIKAGLRELERCGYLQRTRERRPDGTLGAAVYFITDEPEAIAALLDEENPRSLPKGDFPPLDPPPQAKPLVVQPPEAEPALVNPPHKKTNSKNPKGKKTTSSPVPSSTGPARVLEGGGGGSPAGNDKHLEAVAFLRALPAPWTAGKATAERLAPLLLEHAADNGWQLDDQLAAKLTENPGGINNYPAVLRRRLEDLPRRDVPRPRPAGSSSSLPPWCGKCGDGNKSARREATYRVFIDDNGFAKKCPACHPDALAARAAA